SECSPVSIRTSKDVVLRGQQYASADEAILADYQSVTDMRNSLDFIEGPLAFSEKRPPDWKGR
ncbi:MAG: enoyl-CoA hydratase, partial [Alphaproteobacteria bacterium]|nr:enoyl-CoA hydratase [Alphaproteobacteria bacterium]